MTQDQYDRTHLWLHDNAGGTSGLSLIPMAEELCEQASKLPQLSTKTHSKWASFCWGWGKDETGGKILEWKPLQPLLGKGAQQEQQTPAYVRSLLAKGFLAIAKRN
jgi:hypothetical protein